jgi:hypothetical protein
MRINPTVQPSPANNDPVFGKQRVKLYPQPLTKASIKVQLPLNPLARAAQQLTKQPLTHEPK